MQSTNTTGSYWVVSNAGDFNDDGFDDLVIGVNKASPFGRFEAGITYVVFGHATSTSTSYQDLDLDDSTFTSSGKGFRVHYINALISRLSINVIFLIYSVDIWCFSRGFIRFKCEYCWRFQCG